jgi:hypothetical protein
MHEANWHFFVDCRSCRRRIVLEKAPSPVEDWAPKPRDREVTCPTCGMEHTYREGEIGRTPIEE